MKKISILVLVIALTATATVVAEDAAPKMFTTDAAVGLSFGVFNSGEFGAFASVATIASLRGGLDGTLLYKVNDVVAVGPSVGLYVLRYTVDGTDYTLFDLPLRLAAKVGTGTTFIEPFAGYYLAPVGFPASGPEVGVRGALNGFFVDASYVLGTYSWTRIAIGFAQADLFRF